MVKTYMVYWGYIGIMENGNYYIVHVPILCYPAIMENQMEKNMNNDMETGII